jgi:hypothetical protein
MSHNLELNKIKQKHINIREILIKYECEEYGDAIIDELCELFGYPNTNLFEVDE